MATQFQPVSVRARFAVPGYSAEQMLSFGQAFAADVRARILRAEDVNDQPARPLKPKYARFKARKYPPAIRNWRLTGRTLDDLQCIHYAPNLAIIGFTDPVALKRMLINNRRVPQFGASPKNIENINRVIDQVSPVIVVEQAA
jgi:hypothetical protein